MVFESNITIFITITILYYYYYYYYYILNIYVYNPSMQFIDIIFNVSKYKYIHDTTIAIYLYYLY